MVKAHSLLYAIYVCLIVSIICAALLYFANLYNILNQFYNSHEDLYIENQSALNYALSNEDDEEKLINPESGIESSFKIKSFGLLNLIIVNSSLKNDTVTSTHFIGNYPENKTALYLSNFSESLSFSGNVKLIGDKKLPSKSIDEKHINNSINALTSSGSLEVSENVLPEINPDFKKIVTAGSAQMVLLKDLEKRNDSVYFNSFQNKPIEIELTASSLQNCVIKGNFILYAKDSITISRNVVLEDVIIKSPIINIENDFKGSLQAFATKKIDVGSNVKLSYPSVLLIYNNSIEKSQISINSNSKIYGAIINFGAPLLNMDENLISVKENSFIIGDIYCTGKLNTKGKVYGSVYTNKIFSQTNSSIYENCIIDAEINISKRPDFFVSIPLFKTKKEVHGIFKKVL